VGWRRSLYPAHSGWKAKRCGKVKPLKKYYCLFCLTSINFYYKVDNRLNINDNEILFQDMEVKGLRDSITEYIRAQIIAGRLAPGQRLNEAGLSETLNVSRSPLREALLVLERENLVVNIPRKGTYVTPMSEENMGMIYQVMEMVELYAIQNLKVKKITHLPELTAAVDESAKVTAPSTEDWEELLLYRRFLANFHSKLVESLGNSHIVQFYKRTSTDLARYQYLQLTKTRSGKEMVNEHKWIIGYIEKGAYNEASELLKVHIKKSYKYKIDALKKHLKK